jgi:acetyltransferase-like isoleucine patch superfamily enzyme
MGFASYEAPTVVGPAAGGHLARFGAWCSLAYDAEIMLDRTVEPRDLGRVALSPQRDEPVAADDPGLRIEVGHDVWLARKAKLLGGIRIGTGAVIATEAVVTDDVRPYAIVAGNPAREVARRFTDEQIEGLLRLAWWDWPEEVVLARYAEMCDPDIDRFLARYLEPTDG